MEKQIQALMNLGLSMEEALQTLADDADIDKGKPKDFDALFGAYLGENNWNSIMNFGAT